MTARLALLAALALTAVPARAEDPRAEGRPPREPAQGSLDVTARLHATADGLVLEIAGARLEVRAVEDGPPGAEPFGPPTPGAHDLRATVSVDGHTRHLLLRFVPPPEHAPPAR